MTLVKIPLVWITAFAVADVSTPPNAPPPSSEQVHSDDTAEVSIKFLTQFLALAKAFYWASALIETALILAPSLSRTLTSSPLQIRLSRQFVATWLLAIAGTALRRSCYHALGRFFTFELSIRRDHQLVTTGPYAIVRHPSYTAAAMCVVGSTASFICPGSWIAECCSARAVTAARAGLVVVGTPLLFLLVRRIENEEKMLKTKFGEEWEAWRRKVRYKLIPGLY